MKKIAKETTVTKYATLYDREDVSESKDYCKRLIVKIKEQLDAVAEEIEKCEHSEDLRKSLSIALSITGHDDEYDQYHYDGLCEKLFDGMKDLEDELYNIEQQEKYGYDRYLEEIAYYI